MYKKKPRHSGNSKSRAASNQKKTSPAPAGRLQTSENNLVPPIRVRTTPVNGEKFVSYIEERKSSPEPVNEPAKSATSILCSSSDSGTSQKAGAELPMSFLNMWKLLGLEKGKSCVIPVLSADDAEPISLFDWDANTGLYFLPIFTYALTLHGSLTYDQERFF